MTIHEQIISDNNWTGYFDSNLTKEQRKIYVALTNPSRQVLYKDDSSLLRVFIEEKIKLSKNNKIYKTKKVLNKIIPKNGKLYHIDSNKRHPEILWSKMPTRNLDLSKNEILKFYNADWIIPYLEKFVTLKMVKPSVLKKKKITNIRMLLKHIYPNLFPEWILKTQLTAHQLIEINNFLEFAEDKESYTKYIFFKPKYPYVHFLIENETNHAAGEFERPRTNFDMSSYYRDIANMCKILNKKFKLCWGFKRLREFHDSLSSEITSYKNLFKNNVKFFPALKHQTLPPDKFELITSGNRLVQEGLDLKHCVATYDQRINAGLCSIYSIEWEGEKYTIEMIEWNVNQCRGFSNKSAPQSLMNYIYKERFDYFLKLKSFVENVSDSLSSEEVDEFNRVKRILGNSLDLKFRNNMSLPNEAIDPIYFPIHLNNNDVNFIDI